MDKEVDRESSAITYFANEKKKKNKLVLSIPNNLNMKSIWAQSRHKYECKSE
jgi:hypothetical protein